MIAAAYLTRETLRTVAAVTGVLLMVTIGARLGGYLDDAVAGKLAPAALGYVLLMRAPEFLVVLAPLAVFVAVLITHARLQASGELTALRAAGWGPGWCALHAGGLALVLAMPLLVMSVTIAPNAAASLQERLARERATAVFQTLRPKRFTAYRHGSGALWTGAIERQSGALVDVMLIDLGWRDAGGTGESGPLTVLRARAGRLERASGGVWLRLESGHRYSVAKPSRGQAPVVRTRRFTRLHRKLSSEDTAAGTAAIRTSKLLGRSAPAARAELHWRFAVPALVPVLALAAAPLAHGRGAGRVRHWLVAASLFAIVLLGVLVGRAEAALDHLAAGWALWWPHGLTVAVAAVLIVVAGRPRAMLP